jgi:hypothetical protein
MKNNSNHSSSDHSLKLVRFEFSHPTATTVSVAGTFNGWHPTTKPMHPSGNGHWLKETALAPGIYEYCLVVDGQWMPDPMAIDAVPNPFGGKNSILKVTGSNGNGASFQPEISISKKTKQNQTAKTTAGLWIDHRKAVISIVSDEGEQTIQIQSNVEKQPGRFEGIRSVTHYGQQAPADDSHEREFTGHLNQYYAEVIGVIRDIDFILIFGPGEAKGELKKRLESAKLARHIISIETADKMTDRQIVAKVRDYFHKNEAA